MPENDYIESLVRRNQNILSSQKVPTDQIEGFVKTLGYVSEFNTSQRLGSLEYQARDAWIKQATALLNHDYEAAGFTITPPSQEQNNIFKAS